MGNERSSEEETLLPGEKSVERRNYFAGGIAPDGLEYDQGYYTDFAWLFIFGYDEITIDLVREDGPSIDTPPPGYTVKTEPITIIDTGKSGGGVSELSGVVTGTTTRDGPWADAVDEAQRGA